MRCIAGDPRQDYHCLPAMRSIAATSSRHTRQTMHRTRIKICGVKDVDTAMAAVDAGATWVGLVFVEKSPRHVTIEDAKSVVKTLPEDVTPIGLFADQHADEINSIIHQVGLEMIQLHGREPQRILDKLDCYQIIRATGFLSKEYAKLDAWESDDRVKFTLIDAPPTGELTGGSGHVFDWEELAARRLSIHKLLMLAGGLTPDNVGEAIRIVQPYAVDVSSGVESSRGVKDIGLIKAFCEAVRAADDTIAAL